MKLAFYVGKGNLIDRIIRWRTKSKYSHVELIFNCIPGGDRSEVYNNLWFSSSPRDGGVRMKTINPKKKSWEFVKIPSTIEEESECFEKALEIEKRKYDFIGAILGAGLKIRVENPRRFFCCEAAVYALKPLMSLNAVSSPGELYQEVTHLIRKEKDNGGKLWR
jgi:hypothetical protein